MHRKSLRNFRILLWGLVAIAGLASTWVFLRPQQTPTQAMANADIGQGDYHLVTHDGAPFTAETLVGAPSLVFFGFTHCPDVCPTTIGDIAGWKEELGAAGDDLRVFLITVDPERDTAGMLGDYVGWIDGGHGVTGTPEEVQNAIRAFRIVASKVPLDNGDYTMNHTAYVMLFDRDGRFDQIFSYQEDPARVVAKLRAALGA
ncbi:SCO family protein [Pseudogemmobacter faecipullorum]|uniref:SCO family protein n=1 Tax=Pseudogemmobacter faecipullorum TaxID=2755041 RepID=A0ABS8CSB3_9RHOB|nr:SCO family protein [Pseudogemmobacter faecipullorum]MCB5412301.1 SCO family protein [Pseudogemmobacter faecipullorum]